MYSMRHAHTLLKEFRRFAEEEKKVLKHENLRTLNWDRKDESPVNYFQVNCDTAKQIQIEELMEAEYRDRSHSVGGDDTKSDKSTPEFGKKRGRRKENGKRESNVLLASFGSGNKEEKPETPPKKQQKSARDKRKASPGKSKFGGDRLTPEEVAKHCKPGDVWTIYGDSVYDISDWVSVHPGGAVLLMQYAGKDCTADFRKHHSWIRLDSFLDGKKVGCMQGAD